jgi:hypothetical protein
MFSKASTKAKENRRVKKKFPILPFIIIIVIILVLVSKKRRWRRKFRKPWWSWTKFTGYPVLSSGSGGREVVLAADLLVEDLAAEAVLVDLAAEASLRWLEWRLVTDSKHSKKKAANCSFFL